MSFLIRKPYKLCSFKCTESLFLKVLLPFMLRDGICDPGMCSELSRWSIHSCCPHLTMSPPSPDSGLCLPIPTRLQRQSSLVVPNFWTQTQSGSTLNLETQKACAHIHNKKVSEAIFCFINHVTFYFIFIPILFLDFQKVLICIKLVISHSLQKNESGTWS